MELKKYIDDIESICSTCDGCDASCAGYTFKNCFESEMEIEEALQLFHTEPEDMCNKVIQIQK